MYVASLQNSAILADAAHSRPSAVSPQREGEAPAELSPRGGFAARLSAAQIERGAAHTNHAQKPDRAREAASAVVSQLFLLPMLEEMRKFPFGEKFASGGRTEKIFGERLDQYIADAVANSDAGMTEMVAAQLRRLDRLRHPDAVAIVGDPIRDRKGIEPSRDREGAVVAQAERHIQQPLPHGRGSEQPLPYGRGSDQSGRPDWQTAVASGLRPGRSRNDTAGKS